MKGWSSTARRATVLCAALALAGCAAAPARPDAPDPLRSFNRSMFTFNQKLDRYVMEPVSNAYIKVTPQPVRTGVTNVFRNLGYPYVILNDLLQGRFKAAVVTGDAFFWNSTVGIGGIFDIGNKFGLNALDQNFGATAGVWGIGEGAYLVLPFVGPSSVRALPGIPLAIFSNPLYYANSSTAQYAASALNAVNTRASLRVQIQLVNQSLDPYSFVRSGYRQRQNNLIRGGEASAQQMLEELGLPPQSDTGSPPSGNSPSK
ncbi:MAG: VacJ family lipoprotein [Gammaproteobacteria bacterium]